MKANKTRLISTLLYWSGLAVASAQGTAFTYQGQLNDNGTPANGSYDLKFSVYDAAATGTLLAGPLTNSATAVSSGLFAVNLDFGAGLFPGADRWLEIGVRTNGTGVFGPLSPRQKLTATPYAITAGNLTGTIGAANVANGTISGAMLAAGAVGSTQLAAGSVTTAALADGAVTAAKMTTVSNWLALTIANPTPATTDSFGSAVAAVGSDRVLIGASSDDTGATGAGAAYLFSTAGTLLTTFTNPVPVANGAFGGALAALGSGRVVIGAGGNAAAAGAAYLYRTNGALLTTFNNPAPAADDLFGYTVAAVGSDRVLISAPLDDTAAMNCGIAYLFNTNGTVVMTFNNPTPVSIDTFGDAVAALGSDRVIITADRDDTGATDAGAAYLFNTNGTLLTTFTNPAPVLNDFFGRSVAAVGTDGILVGTPGKDTGAQNAGVAYLFSTNGTLLRTITNPAPVGAFGGSFGNSVAAVGNDRVLIGAQFNDGGAPATGVAYLFSTNGTLLTTFTNPTPADFEGFGSAVAAVGSDRVLIGTPTDSAGAVGSGVAYLFGLAQFTPGLVADSVRPDSVTGASLADGSVTISKLDPSIGIWIRSGDNVIRESGNVGIGLMIPTNKLHVAGGVSATAYVTTSDRNAKENFTPVSASDVLAKVAALPISTWNYKELRDGRHMGPTAQDFYAAFGLGGSDTTVTTVDPDGVALAAIQGLDQEVESGKQKAELRMKRLEAENAALKRRLEKLEQTVGEKVNGGAR